MNITNADIVMLSLFRWDGPYSSISIAMAKELSKTRRVFYINHPFSLRDYQKNDAELASVRDQIDKKRVTFHPQPAFPNLITITPAATMPINFLPSGWVYNQAAIQNNQKIHQTIESIIDRYGLDRYVYINCFDPFYPTVLPAKYKPLLNIYQCVDDISQEAYIARHGIRLEKEAIQKADLTLVTSRELYRLKSRYSKNIHLLSNAVDADQFSQAINTNFSRPAELSGINGKIIGYIGNMDGQRVDYALLYELMKHHADKTLVMVGPLNNQQYKKVGLDQLPNVIFTGAKPIGELPAYLQYFDCGIIPFKQNTLTKSIYPLKINEYLAAGKAVVSTNFSKDIATFRDTIYLADSTTDFIEKIDLAVIDNAPDQIKARTLVAGQNTWTARIADFDNIVCQYLQLNGQHRMAEAY